MPLRGPCKPRAAARETTSNNASPWKHFQLICPSEAVPFHGTLSRHGKTRASSVLLMAYRKSCILLFTLQQDCNTRKACRLFIVVKVVQVVFHYKQELLSPRRFHFMVPFLAMAKFELCLSMAYRKSCIMLFTLQQDCNTRVACRLLFVVKVVQVVFPYSAGKHTRWLSTQQAAFPPPLHFIAHYRTGSHGFARQRILSHNGGGEKL